MKSNIPEKADESERLSVGVSRAMNFVVPSANMSDIRDSECSDAGAAQKRLEKEDTFLFFFSFFLHSYL